MTANEFTNYEDFRRHCLEHAAATYVRQLNRTVPLASLPEEDAEVWIRSWWSRERERSRTQ